MKTMLESRWKIALCTLVLLLAVVSWASLRQRARKSPPDEESRVDFIGFADYTKPAVVANHGEDLLSHSFAASHGGPGIRLALDGVENGIGYGAPVKVDRDLIFSETRPFEPVRLTTVESWMKAALGRTRLFEIVEGRIGYPASSEQDHASTDRLRSTTTKTTNANVIPPTEYRLSASVDEWALGRSSSEPRFGSKKTREPQATVGIAFRVVDAQTGQVLFATAERAKLATAAADGSANTPLHHAVQACIDKGTHRLVHWFGLRPWTGTVSAVEGEKAYINAGSHRGLAEGMLFDVLAPGKRLLDPETGSNVGSVTEKIGQLRVVNVEQHVSQATIVEGCDDLRPGARVELRP